MTRRSANRSIRLAPLALALAGCAIATGAGSAASGATPDAERVARAGHAPPTAAEVRRATERFLARHPEAASPHARRQRGPVEPPPQPVSVFPENRMVAFYGAPQLSKTIVGRKSPSGAARELVEQAAAYEGTELRPVIPAFDLIAVIANSTRGRDGRYRTRQDPAVIDAYLAEAREVGARLMLDIQPARANVLAEIRALRPWLAEPDVDVAIDAEWVVGRRGVPGRTKGKLTSKKLNRASRLVQGTVDAEGLPAKVLLVHQFHKRSVRKKRRIKQREDVEVTLNYDGIGGKRAKKAGYAQLSKRRLFNGFSIFYLLDRGLMKPRGVMRLDPEPDFVLYQ